MGRTVIKGDDGFFRISGRPESEYFADPHHAHKVAANLDAADAEATPACAETEAEQDLRIARELAGDDAGDVVNSD